MNNQERRVQLKKGVQRRIIMGVANDLGSLKNLAIELNIPYSTLKNYALETILLPEKLFEKIVELSKIQRETLKVFYLQCNWGMIKGGKKGMATLQKKYSKELIEWRKKGFKNTNIIGYNTKKIKTPILDERLAEFIGAYLGDGTLTKYFVRISGDYRYDIPYFNYLKSLAYKLFGIKATITKSKKHNTAYLTVFSTKMCSFLKEEYGIKYGHKIRNKTIIPEKILKNNMLTLACLRGLLDTDGSVSRRGRKGSQFCIQFTSHNKELLKQVCDFGKRVGIFTFGDSTGTGTNKWENIVEYFRIIGSSNLRHIVRFNERVKGNTLYQREVVDYYQKDFYKNINLPFKLKRGV